MKQLSILHDSTKFNERRRRRHEKTTSRFSYNFLISPKPLCFQNVFQLSRNLIDISGLENRNDKIQNLSSSTHVVNTTAKPVILRLVRKGTASKCTKDSKEHVPMFSSLDSIKYYFTHPPKFDVDRFFSQISFDILFLGCTECWFWIKYTNFLLSTNYDLKTANIPWQCPFNNLTQTDVIGSPSNVCFETARSIRDQKLRISVLVNRPVVPAEMQMCKYHVFCTNTKQQVSYGRQNALIMALNIP